MRALFFLISFSLVCLTSCHHDQDPGHVNNRVLQISSLRLGSKNLDLSSAANNTGGAIDQPLVGSFSSALDRSSVPSAVKLVDGTDTLDVTFAYLDEDKTLSVKPITNLKNDHSYSLLLKKSLKGNDDSVFPGLTVGFRTVKGVLQLVSLKIGNTEVLATQTRIVNVSRTFSATARFSVPLDVATINSTSVNLFKSGGSPAMTTTLSENNTVVTINVPQPLEGLSKYVLGFSSALKGSQQEEFTMLNKTFYTELDPTPKFPLISDDELFTKVQQQTFRYFWDYAHPASGMARERNGSGDVVTTGGSGFGVMSLIVGIDRSFITRQEGVDRLDKILDFLETADRFHGAWSHWINGNTGKVIPFGTKDNGGDLVETSFLIQGLLTARQYLQPSDTVGNNLIRRITKVYDQVEWDWYRKNDENVLYWHWSPNYTWDMNFPLYGYFEEQVTYILAAASSTHAIPKEVYSNGYGRNGAIATNNNYYGYQLPLGEPSPLFWVQYSYLGMDPHFSDDYANYWTQNVNASLINYSYCVANPRNFVGYSDSCWGLTASDNQDGYSAHSPNNDLGVISPTAALSSFPYTPDESMRAMKFFYYNLGDKLWGDYGFYDAFNLTEGWYANSYLAIDQGPIIVMIENHRTGLLWNLFMSAPEVQKAKTTLGLTF